MARSRRKTPVRGITTSQSEKRNKQAAHRKQRRVVKRVLANGKSDQLPAGKEFGNPWDAWKDGKQRFDPKKHPKLIRK